MCVEHLYLSTVNVTFVKLITIFIKPVSKVSLIENSIIMKM